MSGFRQHKKVWFLVVTCLVALNSYGKKITYNENKLGGDFRIILYAENRTNTDELAERAYSLVDSLNEVFSSYLKKSEISRLNKKGVLKNPSSNLLELIAFSENAFLKTNGYFDVSIQPIINYWKKAYKKQKVPSKSCLEKFRKFIGFKTVFRSKNDDIIQLVNRARLNFGGIAKGYIIDKVFELLKSNEVEAFLIEAAGDIRVFGIPEDSDAWTVGVSSDQNSNFVVHLKSGQAIATSGSTYRYSIIKGERYSHIINPKTLKPVSHEMISSVIAGDATTADYLASAFNILSEKNKISEILSDFENVELLLFNNNGTIFKTAGFAKENVF